MSAVNFDSVNNNSLVDALSPELAKQISFAEANFQKGNTVHFDSLDELDEFLDRSCPRKIDKNVDIPNATTIAAMKEADSGVELDDVCVDNVDAFLASVL